MRGDRRIESLRVLGALSVFAYHFMGDVEAALSPAFSANPIWHAIRTWSGPFGVSLFVVISGLVCTWAWPRTAGWREFVRRRLAALFPLFWWVAIPLIAVAILLHRMPLGDLWKVPFWLTGLGIVSPATYFPVVDGWWYMTLALQLVLLFPLAHAVRQRLGALGFVVLAGVLTALSVVALRGAGAAWAIDGFAGARLFEFAVGMTLGSALATGERGWPSLPSLMAIVAAGALAGVAWGASAPAVVLGPLVVVLALGLARNFSGRGAAAVAWGGALSFPFYLSHSPWAKPVISAVNAVAVRVHLGSDALVALASAVVALGVAMLVAWGFARSFAWMRTRVLG